MGAKTAAKPRRRSRKLLRQVVVRLEQPGPYDRLLHESNRRTRKEGRRVPMTQIMREALDQYLA